MQINSSYAFCKLRNLRITIGAKSGLKKSLKIDPKLNVMVEGCGDAWRSSSAGAASPVQPPFDVSNRPTRAFAGDDWVCLDQFKDGWRSTAAAGSSVSSQIRHPARGWRRLGPGHESRLRAIDKIDKYLNIGKLLAYFRNVGYDRAMLVKANLLIPTVPKSPQPQLAFSARNGPPKA
jgi:hypothetical protein